MRRHFRGECRETARMVTPARPICPYSDSRASRRVPSDTYLSVLIGFFSSTKLSQYGVSLHIEGFFCALPLMVAECRYLSTRGSVG